MARDTDPGQLTTASSGLLEVVAAGLKRQAVNFRRFSVSKPMGAAGAVIVVVIVLASIFANVVSPFDPYVSNLNEKGLPVRLEGPGLPFLQANSLLSSPC